MGSGLRRWLRTGLFGGGELLQASQPQLRTMRFIHDEKGHWKAASGSPGGERYIRRVGDHSELWEEAFRQVLSLSELQAAGRGKSASGSLAHGPQGIMMSLVARAPGE